MNTSGKKNTGGYFFIFLVFLFMVFILILTVTYFYNNKNNTAMECYGEGGFIKYVEFKVSYEALEDTMKIDINSNNEEYKISWIDLLAFCAAKYGGDFTKYRKLDLNEVMEQLKAGESIDKISSGMTNFSYYKEAYTAVLSGFLKEYQIETSKDSEQNPVMETKYGLAVFSPIAKTFPFEHYDDFGSTRSYGYTRPHLGHDLMASTGTPVVAIESGTIETMGWNQYGGWRIGIRSYDKKRYYYYAHLRQNKPFHENLSEGQEVTAGDVIGYVGRTGYSTKENTNNIENSHLHVGMELIFDESQKECDNEIWIDLYSIIKLLEKNKCEVYRIAENKEFYRKYQFKLIE